MSKIELSLESNIKLINANGMSGWKVDSKTLEPLIVRITKNFYCPHAESIALECLRLWKKTQDRDFVCSFLLIAYDLEEMWRGRNTMRTFVAMLKSQWAFEQIPFNSLSMLNDSMLDELETYFRGIPYKDYLFTGYWRSVRRRTLDHFGNECQAKIQGILCGSQENLEVHHRHYQNARGKEHLHYKTDLVPLCSYHHATHHLQAQEEHSPHKVAESGAKWGTK